MFLTPLSIQGPNSRMDTLLVAERPNVSGVYISSALAGGTTNLPGVVARAVARQGTEVREHPALEGLPEALAGALRSGDRITAQGDRHPGQGRPVLISDQTVDRNRPASPRVRGGAHQSFSSPRGVRSRSS